MKRILSHPAPLETGKRYWRSVEELADEPTFREWLIREFPSGAAELEMNGVSRRGFIQLMGASLALAGLGFGGCRRPEIHLAGLTKSVEWSIPGKALYYASAMPRRTGAMPLVVTTYDGRPTKIEGNPLHPACSGATDLQAQATILDLYNPDRSKAFLRMGRQVTSADFEGQLQTLLGEAGTGEGMAFVLDVNNSPTRERLKKEILTKYPAAQWCVHDPTGSQVAEAIADAFGEGVSILPNLQEADVILSLDCDFLGVDAIGTESIRQFSARRKADDLTKPMNRLYAVENRYTLSGGMADHRLRLPAGHIPAFAAALAREIAQLTGRHELTGLPSIPDGLNVDPDWIRECAADLVRAAGRSLILVGPRQPVATQRLGYAINAALGNLGKSLLGIQAFPSPSIDLGELVKLVRAGKIRTLFILESNPVYSAPADLDFVSALKKVQQVIHLGLRKDETADVATWHIPGTHFLESWDDGFTPEGSYVPVQPMILPLFGGLSVNDLLTMIAGNQTPIGAEQVKATFQLLGGKNWSGFLRNGWMPGRGGVDLIYRSGPFPPLIISQALEVVFPPDYKIPDGNSIDNGWLQELPDPITKLTWDNAALMSRRLAREHGLEDNDRIRISVGEHSLETVVLVSPGHAENSITLTRGYGHPAGSTGKVGENAGFNANRLITSAEPYVGTGAKIEKIDGKYQLAITQEHHAMEGRELVREATLAHFQENPKFSQMQSGESSTPSHRSLYSHPPLTAREQWGMVIDLNTCTGCSACTIACQAENNIPIVGKEQVANSREMHWLRIDRYFVTSDDEASESDPEMVMQPLACQQCENAPCETVCPVNATAHSDDGLNMMTYNRCIGTRYCANNCPFKVRRFNFFNYNERPIEKIKVGPLPEAGGLYYGPLAPKGMPELTRMSKNPNVTVRIRGVMEKCTYCVQRIEEGRIKARVKAGASKPAGIPTDSIQSACMQACPSQAITFGDLKDPASQVAALQKDPRRYRLLDYLNLETRTSFLARIRNPNPKMPVRQKGVTS